MCIFFKYTNHWTVICDVLLLSIQVHVVFDCQRKFISLKWNPHKGNRNYQLQAVQTIPFYQEQGVTRQRRFIGQWWTLNIQLLADKWLLTAYWNCIEWEIKKKGLNHRWIKLNKTFITIYASRTIFGTLILDKNSTKRNVKNSHFGWWGKRWLHWPHRVTLNLCGCEKPQSTQQLGHEKSQWNTKYQCSLAHDFALQYI